MHASYCVTSFSETVGFQWFYRHVSRISTAFWHSVFYENCMQCPHNSSVLGERSGNSKQASEITHTHTHTQRAFEFHFQRWIRGADLG